MELTVAELRKIIEDSGINSSDRTEGAALIYVADEKLCLGEMIPGSLVLAPPLLAEIDSRFDKAKRIILYGRDEDDERPFLAADELIKTGFTEVYILNGGAENWMRRNP